MTLNEFIEKEWSSLSENWEESYTLDNIHELNAHIMLNESGLRSGGFSDEDKKIITLQTDFLKSLHKKKKK